jgi:bacterioferritin (cytochrome b1)
MSNCCDCNTIATIVENQAIAQLRAQEKLVENLKDHIDKRALEIIIKDLEHLKALDFEQFLKAILQRVNESEANSWNGVPR